MMRFLPRCRLLPSSRVSHSNTLFFSQNTCIASRFSRRKFSSFEKANFQELQSTLFEGESNVFKQLDRLLSLLKQRSTISKDDLGKMTNQERKTKEQEMERDKNLYEDLELFKRKAKAAVEASVDDRSRFEAQSSEKFQLLVENIIKDDQAAGVQILTRYFGYSPSVAENDFQHLQKCYSELPEDQKENFEQTAVSLSVGISSHHKLTEQDRATRIWEHASEDSSTFVEEEEKKKNQQRLRGQKPFTPLLREGDFNYREQQATLFKEELPKPKALQERASGLFSELVHDESTPELKRWFRENVKEAMQHEETEEEFWALRSELKQLLQASKMKEDPEMLTAIQNNQLEEILRAADERGENLMKNMNQLVQLLQSVPKQTSQ